MENSEENKKKELKKKRIMNKLLNIKDATYQEKLMLALAFLAILMVLTFILQSIMGEKSNIDYKIEDGRALFESGYVYDDREVYWILNDIIYTFVSSYEDELTYSKINEKNNNKYNRKEFYTVLSDEYKKNLSMSKYLEVSKNMLEKFVVGNRSLRKNNFIAQIRKLNVTNYADNMYVCKLNTENQEDSYIGIKLSPSTKNYAIFYLE